MNTEEATYMCNTDKSKSSLVDAIKQIDKERNIIKDKGRQTYLETNAHQFSRIAHDYSANNKGLFEERLM